MELVLTVLGIMTILLLTVGFIYQYRFNKKYVKRREESYYNTFLLRELAVGNEKNNNIKYD